MKKFLILFGLLTVLSTSAFAKTINADELNFNFIGSFNTLESNTSVNSFGGLFGYRLMLTDLWGFKVETAIIFPSSSSEVSKQFFVSDSSLGISILLYNKSKIKAFITPAIGYSYMTDSFFTKDTYAEITYLWLGAGLDMNYDMFDGLCLQAGCNVEYKFFRFDKDNKGTNLITIVPKVGFALYF